MNIEEAMATNKSIRVRRTNINDPVDCVEFESIHSAMRKCKKSYITIKDSSIHNKIINGYRWEVVSSTVVPFVSTDINIDIDIDIDTPVYSTENNIREEYVIEPEDNIIEPLTPVEIPSLTYFSESIYEPIDKSISKRQRQPCSCILM